MKLHFNSEDYNCFEEAIRLLLYLIDELKNTDNTYHLCLFKGDDLLISYCIP